MHGLNPKPHRDLYLLAAQSLLSSHSTPPYLAFYCCSASISCSYLQVRLTVGAVAALLPGTSVVASCPVRGMSKNRIEWLKNDRPLRKSRRSYVSNNGKLRISDSRPERDTGNYTCLAGPARADLEIVFSDLFAVVQVWGCWVTCWRFGQPFDAVDVGISHLVLLMLFGVGCVSVCQLILVLLM